VAGSIHFLITLPKRMASEEPIALDRLRVGPNRTGRRPEGNTPHYLLFPYLPQWSDAFVSQDQEPATKNQDTGSQQEQDSHAIVRSR